MIVGFTGTRSGMTDLQKGSVTKILKEFDADTVGLHGDCIGADNDFNDICAALNFERNMRPCTIENMRANSDAVPLSEPVSPMVRNRAIVKDAKVMIACPPNFEMVKRSGTWATIGFTRKAGKPLFLVFPDGKIVIERIKHKNA